MRNFVFIGFAGFGVAGHVRSQATALDTRVLTDFSLWLDDRIVLAAGCFIP